jgi:hypothetical protein
MHEFLYLSSPNLAFLEFYIMPYGEKGDLVKCSDNICLRGFIQNLLCIFLRMEWFYTKFGSLDDFLKFNLNKEIGKGFTSDWATFGPQPTALWACGPLGVTCHLGRRPACDPLSRPRPGQRVGARPGAVTAPTASVVVRSVADHRRPRCSAPCRLSTYASWSRRRARSLGLRCTSEAGRRRVCTVVTMFDSRGRSAGGQRCSEVSPAGQWE